MSFKKPVVFSLISLISAVGARPAHAQTDAVIHACYVQQTGLLRVVTSESDCRVNEAPLAWNIVGPPGPPGTITPPLVVTGSDDVAPIQGINTGGGSSAAGAFAGIHGNGFTGVTGDGVYGVVGRSGVQTGVLGSGRVTGVSGNSLASAGQGGQFTSAGGLGIGVAGMSTAASDLSPAGTGVRGQAADLIQPQYLICDGGPGVGPCRAVAGVGVSGQGYYGVVGKGRTSVTPGVDAAEQGTGVRGDGYYGIYGASTTGFAGYFDGHVQVNGTLTATTLVQNSSRNLKANFLPVDGQAILRKLITLPIQSWNFQSDPAYVRHIGPMAQDFFAAFSVGADADHIATVDEGGVALAAIQALHQLIRHQDETIERMVDRVESLERQFGSLKP